MFRIIDKGLGWHVTGLWHGEDRVVFWPTVRAPGTSANFRALRSCIRWVNENT